MAGVAGPMLRRSRPQGTRFLMGLLTGGVFASVLLAPVLFSLGIVLEQLLSPTPRYVGSGLALGALGLLDIANRTPHIWRQVPQALVRTLPPWRLGAVWGFDLSMLFTTQKSTSLTWSALLGTAFISPTSAWWVLIGMTVTSVAVIASRSVHFAIRGPSDMGDWLQWWFTPMRRASGLSQIALAIVLVTEGVLG
jgi:hypothetical protein